MTEVIPWHTFTASSSTSILRRCFHYTWFLKEYCFFDANFQGKVIADWKSTSTHFIFITEQKDTEEEDEEEQRLIIRLLLSVSSPCGSHLWSGVQTEEEKEGRSQSEPVRGERKEGGVSLAGDRESSSVWRQWTKPGALIRPAVVYQS